jgi:hypothetical protein
VSESVSLLGGVVYCGCCLYVRVQVSPVWARMEGFPFWPARVCSNIERSFLIARGAATAKAEDKVAIVFLGLSKQRCIQSILSVC